MPGQNDTNQIRVTLYIPGTNRITKPIVGGRFSFDDIPEGSYQIIIDPTLGDYVVVILDTVISSGQELDLDTILINLYEPDTIEINTTSITGIWGPNKIYKINNDLEVPQGGILSILPGSEILIMGDYELENKGTLFVSGDSSNFITFDYGYTNGLWKGIVCSGDSSNFSYTIIQNSMCGIDFNSSDYEKHVSNSVIRRCNIGLLVHNSLSDVFLINNIFHNLNENPSGVNVAIDLSTADRNFTCTMRNNIITNNYTAIRRCFYTNNNADVTLIIENNCICNNSENDFVYRDWDQVQGSDETPYEPISIGMVNQDPKFIDLSDGSEDYYFQDDSPCLGTGINGTDMGIYSQYEQ
jgi:hypothetical protein